MGNHSEDSDDKYLDKLGKTSKRYCQKRYVDKKGKPRVCMKKSGHWGKCGH